MPSITETLFYLGLGDNVVGRTKFCIHPADKVKQVQKIGGTKNINIELIKALSPDLIIANKEENVKEDVEELTELYPVYVSLVSDWQSSLDMILDIGKICRISEKANKLVMKLNRAREQDLLSPNKRALYLIWKDPYMSVGGDTFISDMLNHAGFINIMGSQIRYPEVDLAILIDQIDILLLSSEPYPFKSTHQTDLEAKYHKPVKLVDGEFFSWYGSRMLKAFSYFKELHRS